MASIKKRVTTKTVTDERTGRQREVEVEVWRAGQLCPLLVGYPPTPVAGLRSPDGRSSLPFVAGDCSSASITGTVGEAEISGAVVGVVVVEPRSHRAERLSAACAGVCGLVSFGCLAACLLVLVAVAGRGCVLHADGAEAVHQCGGSSVDAMFFVPTIDGGVFGMASVW